MSRTNPIGVTSALRDCPTCFFSVCLVARAGRNCCDRAVQLGTAWLGRPAIAQGPYSCASPWHGHDIGSCLCHRNGSFSVCSQPGRGLRCKPVGAPRLPIVSSSIATVLDAATGIPNAAVVQHVAGPIAVRGACASTPSATVDGESACAAIVPCATTGRVGVSVHSRCLDSARICPSEHRDDIDAEHLHHPRACWVSVSCVLVARPRLAASLPVACQRP